VGAVTAAHLLDQSADELATTAAALSKIAIELNATSKGLTEATPDGLRETALALQTEALRALLGAFAARAVAERLSVLSQLEATDGG
jgi:hypothetical protein